MVLCSYDSIRFDLLGVAEFIDNHHLNGHSKQHINIASCFPATRSAAVPAFRCKTAKCQYAAYVSM
jgi:hypothetical protein